MEKVSEFSKILDEVKNRFSSRFITYFIIYWLIFHWQITVGLLWYDKSQIQAEGCKSIFEFIKDQLIINNHWGKAVLYAFGSTISFPIIKTGILAFDACIIVKRKNWISKINKDELFNKNIELEKKLTSIADVNFLNGDWFYTYQGIKKQILITNSVWYEKDEHGHVVKVFQIIYFYLNQHNNSLLFFLEGFQDKDVYNRQTFTFSNIISPNILVGNINFDNEIKLERIQTFVLDKTNNQPAFKKLMNSFRGVKIIEKQPKTP